MRRLTVLSLFRQLVFPGLCYKKSLLAKLIMYRIKMARLSLSVTSTLT
jgi:hypothetical protein